MADANPDGTAEKKGSKKRLLLLAVPLILVLAGAAYFFFLRPSGAEAAAAAEHAKPKEPGQVLTLEPVTLNLADGHYLKVGIALQMAKEEGAAEEESAPKAEEVATKGAKALDAAIGLLSRHTMADLTAPARRDKAKQQLTHAVAERYDGEVLAVYFTEFVMQ